MTNSLANRCVVAEGAFLRGSSVVSGASYV
jgi:hypothetical protein